jgi:hypothetical protein
MKEVAFLIPICSFNLPEGKVEEQHFYKILLSSILPYNYNYNIRLFLGYNDTDPVYSKLKNREYIDDMINQKENVHVTWQVFNEEYLGKPTHIWNDLCYKALMMGYEYSFVCGDDISFPKDTGWIGRMIKGLKSTDNLGIAGGDSGNPSLPMTQFMIHKKHFEMFSFVFPPQIHAWHCDNWVQEVYPKKYVHYFPDIKVWNCGGQPRYNPKNDRKLCDMLVRRHKPRVIREISS